MNPDMGRGGGYEFQWVLSLYLHTLMKDETYKLDKTKLVKGKNFSFFARKLLNFKNKCIQKYGTNFNFKLEVLVEGEDNCLDDITFISDSNIELVDNIIFIQVKTKGGNKKNTIYTSDGVYKAIKNFLENLNFLKFIKFGNISFFIITNKELAKSLRKKIDSKGPELYMDFVNHIIGLNNLNKDINKEIIIGLLNNKLSITEEMLKVYDKAKITEFRELVYKLKIIFKSLEIIEDIDYDLLRQELEQHFGEYKFLKEKDRVSHLCWDGKEIHKGTPEFEKYEQYKNTFFKPKDGGKLINEISTITKGKFI